MTRRVYNQTRVCFHRLPSCSNLRRVVLHAEMSLKTLGTALTRTLWTSGNTTPPLARSPKVKRLSTTCPVSAGGKHGCGKTKEQSCSSGSTRPSTGDVPSPRELPHRAAAGGEKRPEEPVGAPGVTGVRRRSFTSYAAPMDQKSHLWHRYNETKRMVYGKHKGPPLYRSSHLPPPPQNNKGM